jgi:hypothetical protein
MLVKYDPVVPANPRLVISHRYEVRAELPPTFLAVEHRHLGRECPEDNHVARPSGIDFSDFRLRSRFVREQGNAVEHVRRPEREL